MKENEWVSVKDAMPGVGKTVLVKHTGNCKTEYHFKENTEESRAILSTGMILPYFSYVFHNEDDPTKFLNVTHWHEIPEKRPEFSKLKKGDLIIIEEKEYENLKSIGFFISNTNNEIILFNKNHDSYFSSDLFYHKINDCKKITRINLEDKTFEEI